MKQAPLLLAIFAAFSPMSLLPDLKSKPVRNQCITCQKKLPPGRPNRQCKECRGKNAAPVKIELLTEKDTAPVVLIELPTERN